MAEKTKSTVTSITLRLMIGATLWISIGLLLASLIVVQQVRVYSETLFDEDLKEEATALITAAGLDIEGQLSFTAPIQSQRFYRPFSGWYWQINLNGATVATSRSLWDQSLFIDTDLKDPQGTARSFSGPRGETLRARQVYSQIEQGDLYILVAGNSEGMAALQRSILRYLLILAPVLVLLFLGLTYLQIRFGLRPLRALTRELRVIRNAENKHLEETYPREIQPLADEINSLQTANTELVERARRQVGNLAHAIKTPLSVIRNAANAANNTVDADLVDKAHKQAVLIQDQIDRHLSLARSAATSQRRGERIDIAQSANAIKKALEKIHADKNLTIDIEVEPDLGLRADKGDMMEMLGNLMENAAKWAKTRIIVSAAPTTDRTAVEISICDDGPGIPKSRRAEALQRGKRLDERTPGTGLGLSIVSEMAELYGGTLSLTEGKLGGLNAVLQFPSETEGA